MIKETIARVVEGRNLTREQARSAMGEIMAGEATAAQIAAYLTALRIKGETIDEITGSAEAMRAKAARIVIKRTKKTNIDADDKDFIPKVIADTCGTGGDGKHTFNISTAAAFVVSGAGVTVAKHGNRNVSSGCGSADVLEALGVKIDLAPQQAKAVIERIGIGFLFAPLYHSAMKHAIGPRREMGIRTIFNILGPLCNPAGAGAQVVGVYSPALTEPLARVLGKLGAGAALVVHGGGYDEITITGPTRVSRLHNGRVRTYEVSPEDAGLKTASARALVGGDAAHNAAMIRELLNGKKGPARDAVLLNAAAALLAAGAADNLKSAAARAAISIDSGAAARKLELLARESNG